MGEYERNEDFELDESPIGVSREDRERSGKAGIYMMVHHPEFLSRWISFSDDFHDEVGASWNTLVALRETCANLNMHKHSFKIYQLGNDDSQASNPTTD